ncbi:MAG TPA: hypothetical protein VGL09_01495 [Methylomirabilota bacterium]
MDAKRGDPENATPETHQHRSDPFEPHERAALADAEAAAAAGGEEELDDLEDDLDDDDVDDDDNNLDVDDESEA